MSSEPLTGGRAEGTREMIKILNGILERNGSVPRAAFMLIDGLDALYLLSDKAEREGMERNVRQLLLAMYARPSVEAVLGNLAKRLLERFGASPQRDGVAPWQAGLPPPRGRDE